MKRKLQAFLRGFGSVLDLGGTMNTPEARNNITIHNSFMADEAALRADWEKVGQDLQKAIDEARKRHSAAMQ